MELPKHFWTYAKASLLLASVLVGYLIGPVPIDSGDSPPPFWLTIIPFVFFSLFLPSFLRQFKPTEQYLTASPWPASPVSPLEDPFACYHFGAWACFAGAVPQTYHALTPYNHDQMVMALFIWSCGAGALLGISGAKRGLKRKMETVDESNRPVPK